MWWDSVFRIVCGNSVGSGTFIKPDIVLSAAHVLVPKPGGSLTSYVIRSILVVQMLGDPNQFRAIDAVVCQEWLDNAHNALFFDMCLIRVAPVHGLGLRTISDFTTPDGPFPVKVHGFDVDLTSMSTGIPIQGTITRRGSVFTSRDISAKNGVSGGPIIIPARGKASKSVVGILTSAPKVAGNTVNIGLPLLDSNFKKLLSNI